MMRQAETVEVLDGKKWHYRKEKAWVLLKDGILFCDPGLHLSLSSHWDYSIAVCTFDRNGL